MSRLTTEPNAWCLEVPENAAHLFRVSLGLQPSEVPKVVFVSGPGDVVGTYNQWVAGKHDDRVPVITYSAMFYSLISALNAEAFIFHEVDGRPSVDDPRFRFTHISRSRPKKRLGRYLAGRSFSAKALTALEKCSPDIVVVGSDAPLRLVRYAARRARLILSVHNTFWSMGEPQNTIIAKVQKHWFRWNLRNISAAVCTSVKCKRQLADILGRNMGLFVETPQFARDEWGAFRLKPRLERLAYVGRIESDKGVFDLLSAFEQVADRCPWVTLCFAGDGAALGRLNRKIENSRHSGRIKSLGRLGGDDVHRLLQEIDLLVCPTRPTFKEGLALVVIEAAMNFLPSVVSSVVPARDLMGDACVVYRAGDVTALRSALEELAGRTAEFSLLQDKVRVRRIKLNNPGDSWGVQLLHAFLHKSINTER